MTVAGGKLLNKHATVDIERPDAKVTGEPKGGARLGTNFPRLLESDEERPSEDEQLIMAELSDRKNPHMNECNAETTHEDTERAPRPRISPSEDDIISEHDRCMGRIPEFVDGTCSRLRFFGMLWRK